MMKQSEHLPTLLSAVRPGISMVILLLTLSLAAGCSKVLQTGGMGKPAQGEVKQPLSKAKPESNKSRFIRQMKPMILAENARVLKQRQRLQALGSRSRLNKRDAAWLQQLAADYRLPLKGKPDAVFRTALLARVDIVPPTMVLAQAANESAWGKSRFARQANNYFGQWCFQKGCGLVPLKRKAGASHEVRSFKSPAGSVRAYLKNMNTSKAYRDFRKLRQDMRRKGQPLNAVRLATGLRHYSERGAAYVKSIQAMIRSLKGTFSDS